MNAIHRSIYPNRIIDDRVIDALAEPLEKGVILLLGRNSGSGPAARDYAALDLLGAADELASQGIDIRSELPTRKQIEADLHRAPAQKVARFGRSGTVRHQWVTYDLREQSGVVCLVCAGSGKQASDDGTQPWIELVDGLVEQYDPVLVFVKEIHRLARVTWLAGPLMGRLQLTGAWLGSAAGIQKVTEATSLPFFVDLNQSAAQATALPVSSRRAMRQRTESAMVDGKAIIAFNHGLPAGLARVRLRTRSGPTPSLLYLDDPRFRPDPSEVASGLSEAVDVHGQPANQVAAIQHLFATAFTPGWIRMDGVRELRRRGFSSDKFRGIGDLDSTIRDSSDTNALSLLRTIFRRLEFYETGELICPVGLDGFEPIVVKGCMPPEGWATAEDFARIREGLKAAPEPRRNFRFTMTGLPVEVDGVACTLRSRPITYERKAADKRPMYNAASIEDGVVSPRVSVPHEEIARFYVTGIAASFDTAVQLFDDTRAASSPELDALWPSRDSAELKRSELQRQCDAIVEEAAAVGGPLSEALKRKFNDELHPQLLAASAEVAELDRKIGEARRRLVEGGRPLAAERLLHLVATLADAASGEFRHLLLGSTRDVTLKRVHSKVRGSARIDHEMTGTLRVHSDGQFADIALHHVWSTGASVAAEDRADDLVELLRAGTPLHEVRVTGKGAAIVALAGRLGVDTKDLLLSRIRDGRIARTALETMYLRDGRTTSELAEVLSEPVEFVERIAELYSDPPTRWLSQQGSYLAALYASAALNDGVGRLEDVARWAGDKRARLSAVVREQGDALELIHGVGYRVRPCGFCGCQRLLPLRIHEAVGPVCWSCRKDRSGLVWPADPYDAYVSGPGIWMMADAADGSASTVTRPSRTMW